MKNSITFLPSAQTVPHNGRQTILQAAMKGKVTLRHKCGGKASCTTCKVHVESGELSPVNRLERQRLGEGQVADGFRLSCQAIPQTTCVVSIPEDPLQRAVRLQLLKQKESEGEE